MQTADPARHANNFDFLRLVAALIGDLFAFLPDRRRDPAKRAAGLGDQQSVPLGLVGVFVFFVISGYLVTESYCRSPKPGGFVLRRFARIYPALIPNGLVCAFVLGPIVTSLPLAAYFAAPELRELPRRVRALWPGPLALPGVLFANTTVGLLINGCVLDARLRSDDVRDGADPRRRARLAAIDLGVPARPRHRRDLVGRAPLADVARLSARLAVDAQPFRRRHGDVFPARADRLPLVLRAARARRAGRVQRRSASSSPFSRCPAAT